MVYKIYTEMPHLKYKDSFYDLEFEIIDTKNEFIEFITNILTGRKSFTSKYGNTLEVLNQQDFDEFLDICLNDFYFKMLERKFLTSPEEIASFNLYLKTLRFEGK